MSRKHDSFRLYRRAEKQWSKGRLRDAFRLFRAAAELGASASYGLLAQFYDHGFGVQRNEDAALYWYRRAYRRGDNATAPNNIGCIWRDRGKRARALMWLHRAVEHGDADANLNIAKIYLLDSRTAAKAIPYLKRVCRSQNVTEGSQEEASYLLKKSATARSRR